MFVTDLFLRKRFSKRLIVLLCLILFSSFLYSQESEVTVITIENSMQTSYKKSEDGENDLIELEGTVEISVKKGKNKSYIKADRVTYNRETEILFASGNVEITTEGASAGGEKTTANSLLMNTATLEGIFDGGRVVQTKSDALNLPSGSTLIVFSDLFGKSQSNTISFKNSKLTFCDDEDPHWHIDATRTWLLPGGEFAFFNALLYVGPVPVLYLPAFYYPKDELIFNPVFSKSDRKGFTVQNTYYIIGRKPLQSSSSSSSSSEETTSSAEALKGLYNFMKPTTLKEQERQGLILHNLDENYSGTTSTYLKVMADYYSNLGYFTGLEGVFQPKNKNITNLKFNVDLGFSKTLFSSTGSDGKTKYTFISPAYTGTELNGTLNGTYWDKSNFMQLEMPFRYGANLELSLAKPIRTTIQLPLYTDPFFYYDFMVRDESMDWISYLLQGDDTTSSQSEYSTFAWKISNSWSPTLPSFLKPYVSSFSVKLDSSLNFGTATAAYEEKDEEGVTQKDEKGNIKYRDDRAKNGDSWTAYTPERKFYYPTEITPATASVSLSGTLFQWPLTSSSTKKEKVTYPVQLIQPEELMSEKQLAQKKEKELEEQKKAAEAAEAEKGEKADGENAETTEKENNIENTETTPDSSPIEEIDQEKSLLKDLIVKLPEFTPAVSSVSVPTGLSYTLGYSIAPAITTKFSYGTTEAYYEKDSTGKEIERTRTYLYTQEDFKWSKIKSFMYTYKMPTSLSSSLKYGGNYFTMTNKFSWDPIIQNHPNTDGVTTSERKSLILADKKAQSQTISNTNSISFKPFAYVPMFADTGVSWNTTLKLFRKDFKGTSSDEEWEEYWKTSDAWESYWLHDYWDKDKWINDDENWDSYDDIKKDEIKKAYQRKIITTNTVNFTFGANELNNKFKQNFTWSMTLPPQQEKHSLSLNLVFPYVSNSFSWSFQEKAKSSSTSTNTAENTENNDSKYEFNTLSQALSVSLFNSSLKLSESLTLNTDKYKLEEAEREGIDILDNLKFSLSWKRITAAFTMSYTQGYWLDEKNEKGGGWVPNTKIINTDVLDESTNTYVTKTTEKSYKDFRPYSLSFSWSPETKTYYKWSKKISFAPGLSTSVIADLIRPTNSYLSVSPSLNFKINDMLTLSFSATSRNSTLYWYFQGNESLYKDCGSWFAPQFFGDLLRSFGIAWGGFSRGSFTANREASGFKLKSLSMTASHDLHDWSFNMTWKFEPKLVKENGQYTYNFDPYISIGIVWKPMDSMKTTIVSEYNKTKEKKVWELNPK